MFSLSCACGFFNVIAFVLQLKSALTISADYHLHIKCRIHIVYILLIQLLPQQLNRLSKTLEMNNFTFTKELNHIVYIRIVAQAQNVVVGCSGFLLWERIP